MPYGASSQLCGDQQHIPPEKHNTAAGDSEVWAADIHVLTAAWTELLQEVFETMQALPTQHIHGAGCKHRQACTSPAPSRATCPAQAGCGICRSRVPRHLGLVNLNLNLSRAQPIDSSPARRPAFHSAMRSEKDHFELVGRVRININSKQ